VKHNYWWLTRGEGSVVVTILIVPEVDQATAEKIVERFFPGSKIEPGTAPQLPHEDVVS
jgi:hypothetical protein